LLFCFVGVTCPGASVQASPFCSLLETDPVPLQPKQAGGANGNYSLAGGQEEPAWLTNLQPEDVANQVSKTPLCIRLL
tara:strand:+ start:373 stop:606 length:234 start_codon:yes stop_codon:yes gene_type:complete